jgi:hypothetical protein
VFFTISRSPFQAFQFQTLPLHLEQGSPSLAFPVPLHWVHLVLLSQWLIPFPPQTMQETLAPKGFLPVPPQKTQLFIGSSISTMPVPLQALHCEFGESSSKESFPVPQQKAHLMMIDMIFQFDDLGK